MDRNFWRGERVRLHAVGQEDLDEVTQLAEEPDTELDRYEDRIYFPLSREQNRTFFEKMAKRDGKDDTFFWLVRDLEGRYVGSIGTFDCDPRVGTFKYGLRILHPYWGKGYATEAIVIVLRYYFRELRYQKATVIVYDFNKRSKGLHEKLGFVQEGRLRRMVYTGGTLYDELYFGMTAEEFAALYPPAELKPR